MKSRAGHPLILATCLTLFSALLVVLAPSASAGACDINFNSTYPPGWTQLSSTPDTWAQTNGVVNTAEMMYVPGGPLVAIGGNFTKVTAPGHAAVNAKNLAILRASDGVVVWAASSMSGWPLTMRAIGGVLYVGGQFTAINGAARKGIAAFNAYTYALLPWAPAIDSGTVRDMEISNAGVAYLAGNASVMAFRISNATRIWTAATTLGVARALLLTPDQTGLFVGGHFQTLAGAPRNQLAEIYPIDSGKVYLPFAPTLRPSTSESAYDGELVLELRWDAEGHLVVGTGGNVNNSVKVLAPWNGGQYWTHNTEGDTQGLAVLGNTILSGMHRSHGNTNSGCPFTFYATQWLDYYGTSGVLPWDSGLNNGTAGIPTASATQAGVNGGVQDYLVDLQNRKVYVVGDFTYHGGVCNYAVATIAPVPCTGGTPLQGLARYSF